MISGYIMYLLAVFYENKFDHHIFEAIFLCPVPLVRLTAVNV